MSDYLQFYRESLVREANQKFAYNSPYQDIRTFNKITVAINEKVEEKRHKIEQDNLADIRKFKEQL